MSLPPKDNDFAFQVESLAQNLLKIGSQFFLRDILAPIGTPKYMNGKEPILHLKTLSIRDNSLELVPIPNSLDLAKLTLSPEEIWKHLSIWAKFHMLDGSQMPAKMASSTRTDARWWAHCEEV